MSAMLIPPQDITFFVDHDIYLFKKLITLARLSMLSHLNFYTNNISDGYCLFCLPRVNIGKNFVKKIYFLITKALHKII